MGFGLVVLSEGFLMNKLYASNRFDPEGNIILLVIMYSSLSLYIYSVCIVLQISAGMKN